MLTWSPLGPKISFWVPDTGTADYDSGFAGMPTLTDLVEAMRPIEESYACS